MRIAFIGGGNMGEAILASLLKKRLFLSEDIVVSDASSSRCNDLRQTYNIQVTADNLEAASGSDILVLAVKPQVVFEVINDLKGKLKKTQLVLSIIAGTTINTLRKGLEHERIVRSMPNTPAQIGEGMTVWTATEEVTTRQKKTARNILEVIGKEIYVDDESQIDMATAISGSGPAYFFLFVEALIGAGQKIGLTHEQVSAMVLQTMLGAGRLLEKSGVPPVELRQKVTSKGGTTAAAIGVFEESHFKNMVENAVTAAYRRARELGGEALNR